MKRAKRYVIGIDEAGRGPLAGPVSVAAVCIKEESYTRIIREFKEVRDSKQLSASQREEWFLKIQESNGRMFYAVSLVGNRTIDKRGIVKAIGLALSRSLQKLSVDPNRAMVLLDGSLKASSIFKNQKTIIGGDSKVKIISLASVVAKVHRDRHMKKKAKEYPQYGFEVHKGYGTRVHIEAIKKHGLSEMHRRSFLKNLIKSK